MVLHRCYRRCFHCGQYCFPVEGILGLPKRYSTALKRFTARCCGFWSYALSAQNLKALCGIRLSPTVVGEIADEVGGVIDALLPDNVASVTSALGDGALWLWSLIFMVFGKTMECLDIYHALEHVAACGKALYGSGSFFTEWYERMRLVLLSEGYAGMEGELLALKELDADRQKAVLSLREYLSKNKERLRYAERLVAGRSIGSGLIEGACKNLVKRRLKQTGACWRVPRANRIAVICAALYSEQWDDCWKMYH